MRHREHTVMCLRLALSILPSWRPSARSTYEHDRIHSSSPNHTQVGSRKMCMGSISRSESFHVSAFVRESPGYRKKHPAGLLS
ncbi:hypothetical protein CC80DRAFT_492778 [Byssothecium circinans]|uniref:Uncharacterized protein n=1 Tax=Byssothecium circinans TaxID=147558 RepID=A0A6A5TT48_9PLEO|nr:hypothetical protein CC80DRAFT_492778 [Byssothecium circinans]